MPRKKAKKDKAASKLKIIFVRYVIAVFVFAVVFVVLLPIGKKPQFCANSISCIKDLSGKYDPLAKKGFFMGRVIESPKLLAEVPTQDTLVLGEATGPKRIEVDLSNQLLKAFEGNNLIYSFPVSTGKWYETPTGIFTIWVKLRYTRMSGGDSSLGTYYNLPNVPYTMFYYNNEFSKWQGFSIHGAYWHDNFGQPMSHGCVNMRIADAKLIFDWAEPPTTGYTTYGDGTKVIVYGVTPVN